MLAFCRRLVAHRAFQRTVLAVIVGNAILLGLETDPGVMARHGGFLHLLNHVVQGVFVLEITLRMTAAAPRFWRFFRDGWNVFDFLVVAVSLLPHIGPFATVARLARVLRALRLFSAFPELRLIVGTMLRSIPSLGNVSLLLALVLYVYGVLGSQIFGRTDPEHWGSLARAVFTLFQVLTLEGWVEIHDAARAATGWAWLYFTSFVVIAVFVVVNLFIAVVINNLESARDEEAAPAGGDAAPAERLERVRRELAEIEHSIRRPE